MQADSTPNGVSSPATAPQNGDAHPIEMSTLPSHDPVKANANSVKPPEAYAAYTGQSREPLPYPSTTLATYIAKHPNHTVKQAMRKLYPKRNPLVRLAHRFQVKHSVIDGMTDAEMAHWEAKGPELRRKAGWKLPGENVEGVEVSELFWKMYLSLMPTIARDPLAGMTTPDLLGSTTTMPLTVISLIPDIIQHFHDVIIRAQKEVFIVTNYWQ